MYSSSVLRIGGQLLAISKSLDAPFLSDFLVALKPILECQIFDG